MIISPITALIEKTAGLSPEAPALLAPGRAPFSYSALAAQNRRVAEDLRTFGIGPAGRVAVVLPNGPDMAAAFLAIAGCAGCAPLNPNYKRKDFDFYLSDLHAQALLVDDAAPEPALEAARAAGLRMLTLRRGTRAGEFDFDASERGTPAADGGPAGPALFLHTSGTTSRPKLVPLSAENLAASAAHIAATLALGPSDRCLNIMPLFHIHGLVAAVLASLSAGASVVCTDGVFANQFFSWMDEFRPTWYTAVPTMHQGILARAPRHADVIRRVPLRFLRSSSASLPPAVMEELESTFAAPVIEAYGMTEAAHQMASNPLPPAARKPGSVGRAAGPEVAIMDEAGVLLPPGSTGEVVIRGPNVTEGYEANPAANQSAFTHGWFRTGDQGWMDEEGYLVLTGRLKELINRGGEKIAPREVDEALLAHPAVRQALAFAIPHAQLGEEVGAAIELHPGADATPGDLRAFAAQRLPAYKVPRVVVVVDTIPKGPTGKLQRIGLADKVGVEAIDDTRLGAYVAPRNHLEARLAALWKELLPGARAGVEDRFEALGGDSLLAVRMLTAAETILGRTIPYQDFVAEGTIASLARSAGPAHEEATAIVPVGCDSVGPPLVCLPGHDGSLLGWSRMAAALSSAPVWAFDYGKLPQADTMEELARRCVIELKTKQPKGPYRLAGVCFGGCLALEMARLLQREGAEVEFLALIDTLNPAWGPSGKAVRSARVRQLGWKAVYHRRALRSMGTGEALRYLGGRAGAFVRNHLELTAARVGTGVFGDVHYRGVMRRYRPAPWSGDAVVVRLPGRRLDAPDLGWRSVIQGDLDSVEIPFHPSGALAGANAGRVAELLEVRLRRLQRAEA